MAKESRPRAIRSAALDALDIERGPAPQEVPLEKVRKGS
jgi:hypothetical protein